MTRTQHFMICVSGFSGAGKDLFTDRLKSHHEAVQTGLADPGKRHMADAYGWEEERLFGSSQHRNVGDMKYPKPIMLELDARVVSQDSDSWYGRPMIPIEISGEFGWWETRWVDSVNESELWTRLMKMTLDTNVNLTKVLSIEMRMGDRPGSVFFFYQKDPRFWLSAREALQVYLETMNTLYPNTWIDKGINTHRKLAELSESKTRPGFYTKEWVYDKMIGVKHGLNYVAEGTPIITCFADFRHVHEHRLAKTAESPNLTPVLIRVIRPSVTKPPFDHRSETEQLRIRNGAFDFVVHNDSSIQSLHEKVDEVVKTITTDGWRHVRWNSSFVLSSRGFDEGYAE